MTKLQSQTIDLKKATQRLDEALQAEKTDLNRDATIQRFEFTFELTWKTLNNVLKENHVAVLGSKSIFREAAKLGLISSPELWFEFLESRNLTSHTYDLEIAEKVYQSAKKFHSEVLDLIKKIESLLVA